MSEPVLSIRGLRRTYVTAAGELPVLKGVDLDVQPGEIVGLIGPSGSGKSSLLHAAGLLEHADDGRISIQGRDCTDLSDRERSHVRLGAIGFVYQFHHLLPEFSALDNVALPMMIAGVSQKTARERAGSILGDLGLRERVQHQPAQLSGGEQQRVAIARAIAKRPAVLLCDEPTGALDVKTGIVVLEAIQRVNRELGTLTVIITHNAVMADMADRVIHFADGRVQRERRNPTRAAPSTLNW